MASFDFEKIEIKNDKKEEVGGRRRRKKKERKRLSPTGLCLLSLSSRSQAHAQATSLPPPFSFVCLPYLCTTTTRYYSNTTTCGPFFSSFSFSFILLYSSCLSFTPDIPFGKTWLNSRPEEGNLRCHWDKERKKKIVTRAILKKSHALDKFIPFILVKNKIYDRIIIIAIKCQL